MSFSGDLEHLPIVDVIQLLHATRKSGILRVKCRKGESQLVFKDGYMVSANHLNNSVRIGKILSDLNVITPEVLDQALQEQASAGPNRKPLIITLLEKGYVNEKDAYKGLEQLIELTIVDILTWKKGVFTLDVLPPGVSDEYRYYPGNLDLEVNVDTQSILMDALRIYDEKMRDGALNLDDEADEGAEDSFPEEEIVLSAEDLGLADLDHLETRTPEVFQSLEVKAPAENIHRRVVKDSAPELSAMEQEELVAFLEQSSQSGTGDPVPGASAQSLIFYSPDALISHAVTTVCKSLGILVFATDEEEHLDPIVARSLARNTLPILAFDTPDKRQPQFSEENIAILRRQKKAAYPDLRIIQIASGKDSGFALQSYGDGVGAVFPRTLREERPGSFIPDTIQFLLSFHAFLSQQVREDDNRLLGRLRNSTLIMRNLKEPPEIARAVLEFVGGIFERSMTLIVRDTEMVAEKSIGVKSAKELGAAPALGLRIPLQGGALIARVVETGEPYYGAPQDPAIANHLFSAIGAPASNTILLLPLKNRGKTVAITYADFGAGESALVDMDVLGILAIQAELVLDNALYRKRHEKPGGDNRN